MPTAERRDLFRRTEAEIVDAIERGTRIYMIAASYGGNEGAAINLKRDRADLDVDLRCLARLRGEPVLAEFECKPLAGEALAKWRKEILRMGYYTTRKERK